MDVDCRVVDYEDRYVNEIGHSWLFNLLFIRIFIFINLGTFFTLFLLVRKIFH